MKRKVFASVLSTLIVISSFSGVLMADVNEETVVTEETEVVVEEAEETQEVLETEFAEEETIEDASEDEEAPDDLAEVTKDVLDVEETDETEAEDIVFDEVAEPVLEEYEVPGTDTLASSFSIKLGDKATGYLYDRDGDGLNEELEIKGTGDLYDQNAPRPEFAFVENVNISEGITSIGNNMFSDCKNLYYANFPKTITRIGDCAFKNTKLGINITIPESVKTIGESAFESCTNLHEVYIRDGLQVIGSKAFKGCTELIKVRLPNTITSLGDECFYGCGKLGEINIPTKISYIPNKCFSECRKLSFTEIPVNIKKIGDEAFSYCNSIEYLKLHDSLEYIGDMALMCTHIENISLPNSITHLGMGALSETDIKSIVVPDKITVIPDHLFGGCRYLKEVKFSAEITKIGLCAFGDCKNLGTLVIPATVTLIDKNAFTGANVEKLVIEGNDVTFGEYVFCSGECKELVMPCNLQNDLKETLYIYRIPKKTFTHTYNNSSDATCNSCGEFREIHPVTMDQFVERLYTTCLGRKSEAAGKEYWLKRLVNGTTGAEAAHQFFFSSEFVNLKLSDKEYITRLYKTFMDRNPDTNGLNYWLGKIKSGYTREQVFQGFINSQEWADMCRQYGILSGGTKTSIVFKEPSKGCYNFAVRLYTTCLGRNPDSTGLKDWVTKLATLKTTGTKAAHGFFFSKEFTSKNYSNEEYIKRLYRTFMGREADQGGIKYWQDKFKSGYTREQVFQGFANSAEFENICIQYGILK